jgi:hypothetical protein
MLVFHIGYAKTATTYLQKRVYPSLEINYLGRKPPEKNIDWVYNIAFDDEFDNKVAIDYLNSKIKPNQVNLISHEVFLRPNNWKKNISRIKAISSQFENVKIILSVRSQFDLIISRHKHDKKSRMFKKRFDQIIDFEGDSVCNWPVCGTGSIFEKAFPMFSNCSCIRNRGKVINIPYYNYHDMNKLIADKFGQENIHYIISENLKENPRNELNRLTDFLGVPQISDDKFNSISQVRDNIASDKAPKNNRDILSEELENRLRNYYSESNQKFDKIANLNLSEFNYY